MEQLKKTYNKLLTRYKRAEAWSTNPKTTLKEKEKYFQQFKGIVDSLNKTITELKTLGLEPTNDEILNGFKDCQ